MTFAFCESEFSWHAGHEVVADYTVGKHIEPQNYMLENKSPQISAFLSHFRF